MPLCVDLDGTLLRTGLLSESLARLLRQKPWLLAMVPFWLLRGTAALRREVARHVVMNAAALPTAMSMSGWLHKQKASGEVLVLVTATDKGLARRVAEHLGIFDEVRVSDGLMLAGGEGFAAPRARPAGLPRRPACTPVG